MAGTQSVDVHGTHDHSPSRQIVEAIAAAEGTSPIGLETPLYEAIDAEALDSLFAGRDTDATVEFTYYGYRVTVRNGESVSITPLD